MSGANEPFFAQAGSVHWGTPVHIYSAARNALGGVIGLDPCGPSLFAKTTLSYPSSDGLNESWVDAAGWRKTCLVNPPFGNSYLYEDRAYSTKEFCRMAEGRAAAERITYERARGQMLKRAVRQTMAEWAAKAIEEAALGMQVIWLSKLSSDTVGVQAILAKADVVCFPLGRISYVPIVADGRVDPAKKANAPSFPSLVAGLGVDRSLFREAFGHMGAIR